MTCKQTRGQGLQPKVSLQLTQDRQEATNSMPTIPKLPHQTEMLQTLKTSTRQVVQCNLNKAGCNVITLTNYIQLKEKQLQQCFCLY